MYNLKLLKIYFGNYDYPVPSDTSCISFQVKLNFFNRATKSRIIYRNSISRPKVTHEIPIVCIQ